MPGVFLWLFIVMENTAAVGSTAAMSTAVVATFSRNIRFLWPLRGVAFVIISEPLRGRRDGFLSFRPAL